VGQAHASPGGSAGGQSRKSNQRKQARRRHNGEIHAFFSRKCAPQPSPPFPGSDPRSREFGRARAASRGPLRCVQGQALRIGPARPNHPKISRPTRRPFGLRREIQAKPRASRRGRAPSRAQAAIHWRAAPGYHVVPQPGKRAISRSLSKLRIVWGCSVTFVSSAFNLSSEDDWPTSRGRRRYLHTSRPLGLAHGRRIAPIDFPARVQYGRQEILRSTAKRFAGTHHRRVQHFPTRRRGQRADPFRIWHATKGVPARRIRLEKAALFPGVFARTSKSIIELKSLAALEKLGVHSVVSADQLLFGGRGRTWLPSPPPGPLNPPVANGRRIP